MRIPVPSSSAVDALTQGSRRIPAGERPLVDQRVGEGVGEQESRRQRSPSLKNELLHRCSSVSTRALTSGVVLPAAKRLSSSRRNTPSP